MQGWACTFLTIRVINNKNLMYTMLTAGKRCRKQCWHIIVYVNSMQWFGKQRRMWDGCKLRSSKHFHVIYVTHRSPQTDRKHRIQRIAAQMSGPKLRCFGIQSFRICFILLLHLKKTAAAIWRQKCLGETSRSVFITVFLRDPKRDHPKYRMFA